MITDKEQKQLLQEEQYAFPYHYIPHSDPQGVASRVRVLGWGFEYLCYQKHLVEKVRKLNPESVLEVGCGDGYFIGALGNSVKERVGADFSAKAIAFAQAFHPEIRFHVGDAAEIEQQFDVVAAIEVLEHIPDEQVAGFLSVLFDRVRPGGVVIICVPSVVLPVNRKHFRHYSTTLLRDQMNDACPKAECVQEEQLCRMPRWMRIYDKLTINKYWTIEIGFISNWLWQQVWKRYRVATERAGRHVVGVYRKPVDA